MIGAKLINSWSCPVERIGLMIKYCRYCRASVVVRGNPRSVVCGCCIHRTSSSSNDDRQGQGCQNSWYWCGLISHDAVVDQLHGQDQTNWTSVPAITSDFDRGCIMRQIQVAPAIAEVGDFVEEAFDLALDILDDEDQMTDVVDRL